MELLGLFLDSLDGALVLELGGNEDVRVRLVVPILDQVLVGLENASILLIVSLSVFSFLLLEIEQVG